MARQTGILQVNGTIGNIVFKKNGTVSTKGGSNKSTFDSAPGMQRTRENAAEFGRAGNAGKQLRLAFRRLVQNAADTVMVARLTKKMREIIATDEVNDRGQRGVIDAEIELLAGFEFNANAKLSQVAFLGYTPDVDRTGGDNKITLAAYVPSRDLVAPQGTTHVKFVAGAASIDFETETAESVFAETAYAPYNSTEVATADIELPLTANSTKPIAIALGVEFYQDVNGTKYSLNNGSYNSLSIVAVDGGV